MTVFARTCLTCICIFLFQIQVANGQNLRYIQCKLMDQSKGEPIPFASIKLKNSTQGLISNADGSFIIPTSLQKVSDTLIVSSIGYYSKEIIISKLNQQELNIISLIEKVESLDEIVITPSKKARRLNAKTIVSFAMKNIPDNYPFTPFSYVGYYRDYQIKDRNYVNLNEAILEVFDPGFDSIDLRATQTRIFEYKKNSEFPIDELAAKPYDYANRTKVIDNATLYGQGGNEYTILRLHDAIRNYDVRTYDFVNQLNVDFVRSHRFKLLKETSIGDVKLYDIKVSKSIEKFRAVGEIYISKDDFKIYKLQYAVYDKTQTGRRNKHLPSSSYQSKKKERKLGKLIYEVIVEYQPYQDIMYPNYISFNNSFDILQPPKFVPIATKSNIARKRFEVTFNNTPNAKDALKKSNYRVWYQNIQLKLDSIQVRDNRILLYPQDASAVFDPNRISILRKSTEKGIAIQIINIKDVDGNVIYEQEAQPYNQFREFFVQQLRLSSAKPLDSLFMIKNRPIFDRQPIVNPKNLSEYWMNTPLKD